MLASTGGSRTSLATIPRGIISLSLAGQAEAVRQGAASSAHPAPRHVRVDGCLQVGWCAAHVSMHGMNGICPGALVGSVGDERTNSAAAVVSDAHWLRPAGDARTDGRRRPEGAGRPPTDRSIDRASSITRPSRPGGEHLIYQHLLLLLVLNTLLQS